MPCVVKASQECVDLLLHVGDVDTRTLPGVDEHMLACPRGQHDMVKALLKCGALSATDSQQCWLDCAACRSILWPQGLPRQVLPRQVLRPAHRGGRAAGRDHARRRHALTLAHRKHPANAALLDVLSAFAGDQQA